MDQSIERHAKRIAMQARRTLIIGLGVVLAALVLVFAFPRLLGGRRGEVEGFLAPFVWFGWVGVLVGIVVLLHGLWLTLVAADLNVRLHDRRSSR